MNFFISLVCLLVLSLCAKAQTSNYNFRFISKSETRIMSEFAMNENIVCGDGVKLDKKIQEAVAAYLSDCSENKDLKNKALFCKSGKNIKLNTNHAEAFRINKSAELMYDISDQTLLKNFSELETQNSALAALEDKLVDLYLDIEMSSQKKEFYHKNLVQIFTLFYYERQNKILSDTQINETKKEFAKYISEYIALKVSKSKTENKILVELRKNIKTAEALLQAGYSLAAKERILFENYAKDTNSNYMSPIDNCNLLEREKIAIRDYTSSGYIEINKSLRAKTQIMSSRIKDINNGLKKLKPYKGFVRRGGHLSPLLDDQYQKQNKVSDMAYVSASTSESFYGTHMFTIKSKNKGFYIADLSANPQEKEVLFLPNTPFLVLDRATQGKTTEFVLSEY